MSAKKRDYREAAQKAKERLAADKWPKSPCEVCGARSWSISENVVSPLTLKEGGIQLGGVTYPSVLLICQRCGNTKFLNALVIGALDPEEAGDDQ